MDEYIPAAVVIGDKSKPFFLIKPFYSTVIQNQYLLNKCYPSAKAKATDPVSQMEIDLQSVAINQTFRILFYYTRLICKSQDLFLIKLMILAYQSNAAPVQRGESRVMFVILTKKVVSFSYCLNNRAPRRIFPISLPKIYSIVRHTLLAICVLFLYNAACFLPLRLGEK